MSDLKFAIKRLTGRFQLLKERSSVLIQLRGGHWMIKADDRQFYGISRTLNVDISFQEDNMYKKQTFGVFRHGFYLNSDEVD
jgi:phosphoserine phosphatase